jgi:uncharacterized protein (TIGR02246 family)
LRPITALLLFAATAAQAAPPPEADIRALVERQQRAWNASDTAAYFSVFAPDAIFVDQARSGNTITPYGRATLKAAQVQTRKFMATSKSAETGEVKSVQVNGEQARALSSVVSTITARGATRTTCVDRQQVFRRDGGRWRITAQTDTVFRCPPRR